MRRSMDSAKTRLVAGVAVTAALLVPLAVFGAPALARSAAVASEYEYGDHSGSGQYQYKVTLCHRTHSKKANHQWVLIRVSSRSVKKHLFHGDTYPPCPAPTPAAPKKHGHDGGKSGDDAVKSGSTTAKSGSDHGKSGSTTAAQTGSDHGKSGSTTAAQTGSDHGKSSAAQSGTNASQSGSDHRQSGGDTGKGHGK